MSEASNLFGYWQHPETQKPIGPGGGGLPMAPHVGRPTSYGAIHVAQLLAPVAVDTTPGTVAGWLSMRSLFGLPRWAVFGGAAVLGYFLATRGGKR